MNAMEPISKKLIRATTNAAIVHTVLTGLMLPFMLIDEIPFWEIFLGANLVVGITATSIVFLGSLPEDYVPMPIEQAVVPEPPTPEKPVPVSVQEARSRIAIDAINKSMQAAKDRLAASAKDDPDMDDDEFGLGGNWWRNNS